MKPQNIHTTYFTVVNISISYHFLSRILQGVHFSKSDSSYTMLENLTFCEKNSWLEDKHFDCFTYLLELQNYRNPDHQDHSIPVIIDPHFYPTLLFDTQKALLGLRKKLPNSNLFQIRNILQKFVYFPFLYTIITGF